MTEIVELARYRQSRRRVYFDKAELSLMMGVYSRQVAAGVWRDYAIDHLDGMAVFSVFRSTFELPVLSVLKLAGRAGKPPDYVLTWGAHRVARSRRLGEVLEAIEKRMGVVD